MKERMTKIGNCFSNTSTFIRISQCEVITNGQGFGLTKAFYKIKNKTRL